jgi:hypothetical protein
LSPIGSDLGKFGLPETQDVGLHPDDLRDFADSKIYFIGNIGRQQPSSFPCSAPGALRKVFQFFPQ